VKEAWTPFGEQRLKEADEEVKGATSGTLGEGALYTHAGDDGVRRVTRDGGVGDNHAEKKD